MSDPILTLLSLGNLIFASANIIIAFSLALYLLANNLRNPVARSFSWLLTFVMFAYIANVFILKVESASAAEFWLKSKWLGIAFVPAAYLHFSDALLRMTGAYSRGRRIALGAAYLASALFFALVVFSDLVVRGQIYYPWATQFGAGPLFWLFTLYFFATTLWGFYNIQRARARSLTATSQRRMTYLTIAFLAPALGVFPYLIASSFPATFSPILLLAVTLIGNLGIALMMVVMGYTVAYQGALAPDRIVKHNLIHYLMRGPLVAICVVAVLFLVPPIERLLGLEHETLLFATVIVGIVALEIIIQVGKPFVDRVIFNQDRRELEQIQSLDRRLLTTTDLRQLLENILSTTCDLLRAQPGFILAATSDQWHIEAATGPREPIRQFLESADLARVVNHPEFTNGHFVAVDGFWVYPLKTKSRENLLGLLGVAARAPSPDLSEREQEFVEAFAAQAELALEDRQLQQGVFQVLEQITNEIEMIQRWRSKPRYTGALASERVEEELAPTPDFHRAVKDALDHYWGGPKLTYSPLLEMNIVKAYLAAYDQNPVRALRAILGEAIEALKPDGTRSLTAPEWLLYNILELKVLRGERVRDIAYKLAISESDLYRKQRAAIEQVAKVLQTMEENKTQVPPV